VDYEIHLILKLVLVQSRFSRSRFRSMVPTRPQFSLAKLGLERQPIKWSIRTLLCQMSSCEAWNSVQGPIRFLKAASLEPRMCGLLNGNQVHTCLDCSSAEIPRSSLPLDHLRPPPSFATLPVLSSPRWHSPSPSILLSPSHPSSKPFNFTFRSLPGSCVESRPH
jgi:hypothetical protein